MPPLPPSHSLRALGQCYNQGQEVIKVAINVTKLGLMQDSKPYFSIGKVLFYFLNLQLDPQALGRSLICKKLWPPTSFFACSGRRQSWKSFSGQGGLHRHSIKLCSPAQYQLKLDSSHARGSTWWKIGWILRNLGT